MPPLTCKCRILWLKYRRSKNINGSGRDKVVTCSLMVVPRRLLMFILKRLLYVKITKTIKIATGCSLDRIQ